MAGFSKDPKTIDDAFVDLFYAYHDIVRHSLLARIDYQSQFYGQVDDCVQEAFVLCFLKYDKLQGHPNLIGWLCTTAWNMMHTYICKVARRDKKLQEVLGPETPLPEDILSDIDRWANQDYAKAQLDIIHGILTDKEHVVYENYFVNGASLQETADITGYTPNTVRSAVERIRKRAKQYQNFLIFLSITRCIFLFWYDI